MSADHTHIDSFYVNCFLHEQWLELVLGWLSKVFASEADGDGTVSAPSVPSLQEGQPANSVLKQWRCHMHQFFCRIYVNMRIEELFSIIRGQMLSLRSVFSFLFLSFKMLN